ncbi:MAG: spore coat protein U domain-containing protein, partial [bacterium]|nr:spore coat protein U domain-containing protein [bacterium]
MKKMFLAVSILTFVLGLSVNAQAATEKTTMDVRGKVQEAPPMVTVSATTLDFGTVPIVPVDECAYYATATITVNATSGLNYNIALDAGLHSDYYCRRMRCDKGYGVYYDIYYCLYKDAAYTQLWGDSDYDNTYAYGTSSGP